MGKDLDKVPADVPKLVKDVSKVIIHPRNVSSDLLKWYRYLPNTPDRLLVNFDLLFDGNGFRFGFRRSASFAAGEAGF
jgi:hypothetical protein